MAQAAAYVKVFSNRYRIGSLSSDSLGQILERNTKEVNNLKKATGNIMPKYVDYFTRYLGNNFDNEKFDEGSKSFDLFTDFGQGLLYDRRDRQNEYHMHVMDDYGQYYVWLRFN